MSLIINMLKDLDNRQHGQSPIPILESAQRPYQRSSGIQWKKWLVVGSIVLMLTAIIIMLSLKKSNVKSVLVLPPESAIVKTNEVTTNSIWTNPVTISSVAFEAKDDMTEMRLSLNHDALYRILGSENKHQIILEIDNAKLNSDLPTFVGAGLGIKSIASVNKQNDLRFLINLNDKASLRSVTLTKEDNQAELVVIINHFTSLPREDVVTATMATAATDIKTESPEVGTTSIESPTTTRNNSIKLPALQSLVINEYQTAIKAAANGRNQEAIDILARLLKTYPDYQDARVSMAAIILEAGNTFEARKIVEEGLSIEPSYLPLIQLKARIYTSEGKISEALLILQSEKPYIDDEPEYHAFIAALLNRQKQYQEAANIYKQLVQINSHDSSWWFGLAISQDKLGNTKEAKLAYLKAAAEGRLNPQAQAYLQSRLSMLQEPPHA